MYVYITCMYVYIYVCIYVLAHKYVYVCKCVCVYIYILYIYLYVYLTTNSILFLEIVVLGAWSQRDWPFKQCSYPNCKIYFHLIYQVHFMHKAQGNINLVYLHSDQWRSIHGYAHENGDNGHGRLANCITACYLCIDCAHQYRDK